MLFPLQMPGGVEVLVVLLVPGVIVAATAFLFLRRRRRVEELEAKLRDRD